VKSEACSRSAARTVLCCSCYDVIPGRPACLAARFGSPPAIVSSGLRRAWRGPAVLLLPAFSTVSTREEMAPLATRLAGRFQTIAADWPGFGRSAAPKLTHSPDLHHAFLAAFVDSVLGGPTAVVAAGHAAGYVLSLARQRPGVWSRIVLVAPTWRGPLPTMMGGYRPLQDRLRAAIETPVIGPGIYRLLAAPSAKSPSSSLRWPW
jgi:pimeloyl-ACP methyl ester carboxylesterase